MDNPSPKITVLFVDDDQAFLETVVGAFEQFSNGAWHVLTANHLDQTLAHLKSQPVDLAVLDVRMPETDGLRLLDRLNHDFPALSKVMFTSAADAATRLAGLEKGAALFLEKPGSLEGLESVFATLGELAKWHRKQRSRGVSSRAGLVEIVRLECASGNSRLIDVTAGDSSGLIYVKTGSILHAEAPGRRGQSAFTFLASHPEAQFVLKQFVEPPERSVTRQWEFLVMEAFQLREQLSQAVQEAKRKETAAQIKPTGTAIPSTKPLQEIATASPGRTELEMVPPSKPLAPAGEEGLPAHPSRIHSPFLKPPAAPKPDSGAPAKTEADRLKLEPTPAALALGVKTGEGSCKIEEMLVCTRQNEVLYEWRCPQTDLRFRCLDVLRHKAQQTARRLSLGSTDRFVFQSLQGRLTVRFQGDTTVLVRSTAAERPMPSKGSPLNIALSDWVSRHVELKGLLACGVIRGQLILVSCSYTNDFPSESLNQGWRSLGELFELVQEQNVVPWQIQWIFEQTQFHCFRRTDGLALALLLTKDARQLDGEGLSKLILEFSSLIVA